MAYFKTTYFDEPMSESSRERCKLVARQYFNDIVCLVFADATPRAMLVECLLRMASGFLYDVSLYRRRDVTDPRHHRHPVR